MLQLLNIKISTKPQRDSVTATNLEIVNLSAWLDGHNEDNRRVKRLELEDNKLTIPASVFARANWYV